MQALEGKAAVVTGAASGMGLAFARRLARAGMDIVLADIEPAALEEAVAGITELGVDALGVVTDVSDEASMDALAAASLERFGRVHVLCNNAGVSGALADGPADIDPADWRWVLGVNLWGVIHGHRAFLPHLLEQGEGHIVNTASMAGHFPGHSAYSASKWAVVGITEGLYHAMQSGRTGVSVSCLCPGFVNTRIASSDRNRPEWAGRALVSDEGASRLVLLQHALVNGMPPEEVADLVHDAIVEDRFWVFTDPAMVAALDDRFRSVLDHRNPAPFPPARQQG